MYPDTYTRKLGFHVMEHMEYGYKSYTIDGDDADYCRRCDTLVLEEDLDDDGICIECREIERENEEEDDHASDTF